MNATTKTRRAAVAAAVGTAACLAATMLSGSPAMAAGDTIKVAFSLDYFMSSPALANKWFGEIKQQFEAAHPGDTLKPIPIPGSFDDFNTKISLMFNSPSTAPDVIQIAAQTAGEWAGSGLLAPLGAQLKTQSWWAAYPDAVKQEAKIDGKVYAISEGVNTFGLLYDRSLLTKAGLPQDWRPKTWNEILDAARAVKKAVPTVSPIWLMTGTAQGSEGVLMGSGLLLAASSTPTMYDKATDKWVVDSKGLREVLGFYRDASADHLLAPASQILDANAPNNGAQHIAAHELGISFAGNYWPQMWNPTICTPCWTDPTNAVGLTPLPTSQGQAPGVGGSFGGWSLSIYSKTPHPDLAWSLIDIMQRKPNMLELDNYGGLVPPVPAYSTDVVYTGFAKEPFQQGFAKLLPTEQSMPATQEFTVWSFALAQATETLVLKPATPIDAVLETMKSYVAGQLGDDRVETLN